MAGYKTLGKAREEDASKEAYRRNRLKDSLVVRPPFQGRGSTGRNAVPGELRAGQ